MYKKCGRCGQRETWRGIEIGGRPYTLSSMGRLRRSVTGLKSARVSGRGYPIFTFWFGSTRKIKRRQYRAVHNLVAETFLGPPSPGHEVNHEDGDKTHNCVGNLKYMTRGQNIEHAYRIGLRHPNTEAANNARRRAS